MYATLKAAVTGGLFALALGGSALAAEQIVDISGYKFLPEQISIKPGDTVTWVNREKRTSHSIVFVDTNTESDRLFPDERWSRTFPAAGRFEYHCGPHTEMKGVVIVGD